MTHFGARIQREINDKVIAKRAEKHAYGIRHQLEKDKEGAEELSRKEIEEQEQIAGFLTDDDFLELIRDSVPSAPMGTLSPKWIQRMCRLNVLLLFRRLHSCRMSCLI